MKTAVIYNPVAGAIRKRPKRLERSIDILRRQGHTLEIHPTTGPLTAGGIARECVAGGAGLIVVAGGDGTVNEVISGMVGTDVPLAVLPAGTANVLSTELGLGARMERVAQRLPVCRPERISVGLLTTEGGLRQRHFLLMCGVGMDALVVTLLIPALKERTGKFAYWVAAMRILSRRLVEFHVRVGEASGTCSLALASRVRNYGGDLEIARGASLRSPDFEVVLFRGSNPFRYARYFAGVLLGRVDRMKGVTVLRGRSLDLEPPGPEPVYIQADGELAGRLPARIEIVDHALTLMMPPAYR